MPDERGRPVFGVDRDPSTIRAADDPCERKPCNHPRKAHLSTGCVGTAPPTAMAPGCPCSGFSGPALTIAG